MFVLAIIGVIALIIVTMMAIAVAVILRGRNCVSYALPRWLRGEAKYLVIRWSRARWRGLRVPHLLIMRHEGSELHHWQPHEFRDGPVADVSSKSLGWIIDHDGYVKTGDK
ncbi:MAG: hypothetical protein HY272_01935 [Gammaproteobacteria bacterium]|nr:hypothetical protein [Gammaproteobacteria bacterium]